MNERNKDNVMKADCMLIGGMNHICIRSEKTDGDSMQRRQRRGGGECYARENIESISSNSLVRLYEDEFVEILI